MRDGVVAGSGRHRCGLRQREARVEDDRAERRFRIAARHFPVRARIGNDGVGLRLAACARSRRHANHRQHRLGRLRITLEIVNDATLGQQKVDSLCAVERAAAAEADDRVDALARRVAPAGLEHVGIGVRTELAELERVDARRFKRRMRVLEMPGPDEPRIGDEQRPRKPQLLRQRSKPIDRTVARQHAYIRRNLQSANPHRNTAATDLSEVCVSQSDRNLSNEVIINSLPRPSSC